jgi:hypothetical protein
MHIDGYKFGRIVINGQTYTDDLIVIPPDVESGWWRREGHSLCVEDLEKVLRARPEILIIGTGASGNMEVPDQVLSRLKRENIEPVVSETGKAVDIFNKKNERGKKVAGAFHLTC